jgi:NTP pyrophosphatase (non-canonical NTP hydrolase)
MELNEYQERSKSTAVYRKSLKTQVGRINYAALGLNGEAGEVANNIKKITRDAKGQMTKEIRARIEDELGDCLWYVSAMCVELKVDLDTIAESNLAKLDERYHGDDA